MSFNWKDYVDLAEELLKREDEASHRSAVSRAYYGVFCIARNRLSMTYDKSRSVHWQVIKRLRESNNPKHKKLAKILSDLKRARERADYEEDSFKREDAKIMVLLSKKALSLLKE